MKPTKILIPQYSDVEVTIRCKHGRLWPPPLMKLNVDIKSMWTNGEISQHDYQQIETWQRVCSQMEMGEKCLSCNLALVEVPRMGAEHHGRVDVLPLVDTIRKAHATKMREEGGPKRPIPPPKAESFDPEPEEFVDDSIDPVEPDYPIPQESNGEVQSFEAEPEPKPEPEPEPEPKPKAEPEPKAEPKSSAQDADDLLDALLDE